MASDVQRRLNELEWRMSSRFKEVERQLQELRELIQKPEARAAEVLKPAPTTEFESDDEPDRSYSMMRVISGMSTMSEIEEMQDPDDHHSYVAHESVWELPLLIGTSVVDLETSICFGFMTAFSTLIQLLFLYVVHETMLEDPLSNERLTALLQFRVGVGHDLAYADASTKKSLVRQLCDEQDVESATGSEQIRLISFLNKCVEGDLGSIMTLAVLAVWIMSLQQEVERISRYNHALWELPRGSTRLALDDTKRVKVLRISQLRWLCLLAVNFVRAAIVLGILYVGSTYVVQTLDLSNLFLNAVSLGFITAVDELVFASLVHSKARNLVKNMQPLPVSSRTWGPLFRSMPVKCFALALTLAVVALMVLQPFQERVLQAQAILCSGNVDFVYVNNPVTGVVTAASSKPDDEAESISASAPVIQLTGLRVSEKMLDAWPDARRIKNIHQSGSQMAEKLPSPTAFGTSFDWRSWRELQELRASSVKSTADGMVCVDTTEVVLQAWAQVQVFVITGAYSKCSDAVALCSRENYTELRGLCPETCCSGPFPAAGYFTSRFYGCPVSCMHQQTTAIHMATVQSNGRLCEDVLPSQWLSQPGPWTYIQSFLNHLLASPLLSSILRLRSDDVAQHFQLPASAGERVLDHLMNESSLLEDARQGRWQLAPGLAHPRNLQGCEFWTSYEVTEFLNIDLCAPHPHRSIRMFCPIACHCAAGKEQCPWSCGKT